MRNLFRSPSKLGVKQKQIKVHYDCVDQEYGVPLGCIVIRRIDVSATMTYGDTIITDTWSYVPDIPYRYDADTIDFALDKVIEYIKLDPSPHSRHIRNVEVFNLDKYPEPDRDYVISEIRDMKKGA